MQSPPVPRYLVSPTSRYSPQHLILKHPQPPFLLQCQRPSFTAIKNNRQDYISIYLDLLLPCAYVKRATEFAEFAEFADCVNCKLPSYSNNRKVISLPGYCVMLIFSKKVHSKITFYDNYEASIANFLYTFRDNLTVPKFCNKLPLLIGQKCRREQSQNSVFCPQRYIWAVFEGLLDEWLKVPQFTTASRWSCHW